MSEPKRYMNLSLDDPYSNTPPSYNTSDELLDAMDAYIEECEAQLVTAYRVDGLLLQSLQH